MGISLDSCQAKFGQPGNPRSHGLGIDASVSNGLGMDAGVMLKNSRILATLWFGGHDRVLMVWALMLRFRMVWAWMLV